MFPFAEEQSFIQNGGQTFTEKLKKYINDFSFFLQK